ncbi:DUF2232 domain-containing protein [Dictyoglomus thermophilum]|uniref:Membrane protein, putative n=2 Tax=Dictyoglomus thermophilum TaxID=14 RepID=B5YEW6_DICT6|nr:DUF2232 domain-containing protein [Dictyoglomus thermophilum]ACI18433.1 membrane protein, putative [Dictyoglomus thermophilum H-6-12]TYT21106.1 DUF2232 domain-containing protein [Dictyoglomus thermophilum]
MNKKLQGLVEGSLITAINVVLAWLSYWFFPITYFIPLPSLILTYRNGLRISFLSLIISIIILSLVLSPFSAVFLILPSGLLGLYLGYGLSKRFNLKLLLAGSFILLLALQLLGIYLSMVLFKMPFEKIIGIDAMREGWKKSLEIFKNYLGNTQNEYIEMQNKFMENLHLFVPSFLIMSALFQVFLNYVIIEKVLKRFRIEAPSLPKLENLRVPKKLVFIIFILYILFAFINIPLRDVILSNLSLCLQFFILINGYILAWILLRYFIKNIVLRILLFIIFVLNPIFGSIIFITGFIDIFFPLREKIIPKEG